MYIRGFFRERDLSTQRTVTIANLALRLQAILIKILQHKLRRAQVALGADGSHHRVYGGFAGEN
jgi:hypothetical protein